MIKLNADESMLLLITKSWEHKDHVLPRYKKKSAKLNGTIIDDYRGSLRYIQECCNLRCFGRTSDFYDDRENKATVYGCYGNLFEKLLSTKQVLRAYENTQELFLTDPPTMLRALLTQLSLLQVQDVLELDYSMVDHTDKERFIGVWVNE